MKTAQTKNVVATLCPSCRRWWRDLQALEGGVEYRRAVAQLRSLKVEARNPGLYVRARSSGGKIGGPAKWGKLTEEERKAAMLRARARIPGKGGEKARAQLAEMGIVVEPKPTTTRP